MDKLFEKSFQKVDRTQVEFHRYLLSVVDWRNRMIGIKGARGAGKTTLLLQYARLNLPQDHRTIYISLDDLYFTENRLVDFAEEFVKQGGRYLLLDEVHRYSDWSVELKNLYDDFPDLKIIFTGSSVLHINRAKGDLSRRAVIFELTGLSYREYLNIKHGFSLPEIVWDDLLYKHTEITRSVLKELRPLEFFNDYLRNGYYPYFLENESSYGQKLSETIDLAMNTDLPVSFDISFAGLEKLKKLLFVLSESVPFQPNVSKLSERIGVTRNTLVQFFVYLEDLRIIKRLYSSSKGIGSLQKPDKLLMHHPNLQYALAHTSPDKGSVRESFFVNQTGYQRDIRFSKKGDFRIDDIIFEIGGKKKTKKQIEGTEKAFIVSDDLEIGVHNRIPLWLFGFLY